MLNINTNYGAAFAANAAKKTSNSFFLADLESNISVLESILSSKISSEKEKNESMN